jgi:hypothetical protein
MIAAVIRADIEGELVRLAGADQLGKRLPIDVAWHFGFDAHDLENVADSPVRVVEVRDGCYLICYQAGVEPLDLDSLRELLGPVGPLAPWRLARLAFDLCSHLRALHAEGIPQLVIHPERVGRWAGRFILLPTLAGVLPPLSRLPSNEIAGWLHYVAPEVLRTRAIAGDLLPTGDVFSLGCLLLALTVPGWDPLDYADTLALAENRVEGLEPEKPGRAPPGFEVLQTLFERLADPLPSKRISLDEALKVLTGLLEELSAERRITEALTAGRIDQADACLRDLERCLRAGVFGCSRRASHLLHADVALARTPPDCRVAMTHLSAAESGEEYEADVRRRMARAYALWTEQPRHLESASYAYRVAARLSGYPAELVDEWVELLRRFPDTGAVLDETDRVPEHLRTRGLVMLRTTILLQRGFPWDAWLEIVPRFARSAFDQELFDLARTVAWRADPMELLLWMRPFRDEPGGQAGPVALVWEVNGNETEAARWLLAARAWRP